MTFVTRGYVDEDVDAIGKETDPRCAQTPCLYKDWNKYKYKKRKSKVSIQNRDTSRSANLFQKDLDIRLNLSAE